MDTEFDCASADYDPEEDRQAYIDLMENQGYVIVYPKINELQIDLDTEDHHTHFLNQWGTLEKMRLDWTYTIAPSKGGLPGQHVTVTTNQELSTVERIAWQATLGSDPKRELLSMIRYLNKSTAPTLFVEVPNQKEVP